MANQTIDTLNSFLRGEISAVETYRQAIEKLHDQPEVSTLTECLHSHEQRVSLLDREIQRLGGRPAQGSGSWGAFAKLLEGGATLFGPKTAIAALEEGEDHAFEGMPHLVRDLHVEGPMQRYPAVAEQLDCVVRRKAREVAFVF